MNSSGYSEFGGDKTTTQVNAPNDCAIYYDRVRYDRGGRRQLLLLLMKNTPNPYHLSLAQFCVATYGIAREIVIVRHSFLLPDGLWLGIAGARVRSCKGHCVSPTARKPFIVFYRPRSRSSFISILFFLCYAPAVPDCQSDGYVHY